MRWVKFLAVFTLLVLLLRIGANVAKADKPIDYLTSKEMANAVVVLDPKGLAPAPFPGDSNSSVSRKAYRLAGCDPNTADKNTPCYFVVTSNRDLGTTHPAQSIMPLSYRATLTCGKNIYNVFGVLLATLQENVNVTFWNQWGRSPVTLNWGNLNGTRTFLIGYTWSDLRGPNPNPGWGIRTNTAYAWASGVLNNWPGMSQYHSILLTINGSGWYCQ